MDCSPPGSSVHGILQARILEWVAMPPPGDLPDPGIKPGSVVSPASAGGFFTTSATWEVHEEAYIRIFEYTDFFQVYIGHSKSVYLIEQKRKKIINVRKENNGK